MLSTDGKKVLQNGTLQALRSMRAVFYRTLRQKIVLLATARSADFDHGPPRPPRAPLKPRRGSSTSPRALNPCCGPLSGLYTPMSGRPYLLYSTRGPKLLTTPGPRIVGILTR